jgi:hypothetical protein
LILDEVRTVVRFGLSRSLAEGTVFVFVSHLNVVAEVVVVVRIVLGINHIAKKAFQFFGLS